MNRGLNLILYDRSEEEEMSRKNDRIAGLSNSHTQNTSQRAQEREPAQDEHQSSASVARHCKRGTILVERRLVVLGDEKIVPSKPMDLRSERALGMYHI
jgi:hypothetical protein